MEMFFNAFKNDKRMRIYGPKNPNEKVPILSFIIGCVLEES